MGALIKFGRENGSGPKVWITFLFDELSRLTTGNGDIKSIADKKLKIFTSPCACCSIALDCLRKAHFRRLRLAGPGSSTPYWPNANSYDWTLNNCHRGEEPASEEVEDLLRI